MERIVMVAGGVETLEYFAREMEKHFKEQGYAVFFFDLRQEEKSAKKLRKFLKPRKTALITFNFQGLEKEAGVYKEGVGYIWDTYQIPCYNIVADHPYFYHERLADLPKKYYHISIDRRHQEYFRQFYPEYTDRGFLPLAGSRYEGEDEEGRSAADVLFTGNYTELPFFEPYIHWINDEYAAFYQGIIDALLKSPHRTVEEVALEHCHREMGENTAEDLRIAMSKMIFIDMYVRNYWRGEVVRTLVDAGIPVEVVGKGWEKLACAHPENLILHPQTDSGSCLNMLSRAKLSLNVMPWFKDGAHDRVFNSIVNGAVCISDGSKYLCEELREGEGICYYRLEQLEALPQMVRRLLADSEQRSRIVHAGRTKIEERHLWRHRARTLLTWIWEDEGGHA
ncbi:MAG: glycosyltransferase [Clostridiales bacterium]|nr:glycosyltransferase [Clostridiales bacterium]